MLVKVIKRKSDEFSLIKTGNIYKAYKLDLDENGYYISLMVGCCRLDSEEVEEVKEV